MYSIQCTLYSVHDYWHNNWALVLYTLYMGWCYLMSFLAIPEHVYVVHCKWNKWSVLDKNLCVCVSGKDWMEAMMERVARACERYWCFNCERFDVVAIIFIHIKTPFGLGTLINVYAFVYLITYLEMDHLFIFYIYKFINSLLTSIY